MEEKNLLFSLADEITRIIYEKTLSFEYKHQSSIGDQLRRASLSIVLNVVEGGAKSTEKERNQYRKISFSSLKETKYLIYFVHKLRLIDDKFYQEIMEKINKLARIMYGLIYRRKS